MSKKISLLPETGNFYKANLHCHTVISDGKLTPEEVKKAYMEQGYSVVAYTDHRNYQWHKELTYEAIVNALLKGNFYSSMGPEIRELYVEDGVLHITTSPVEKIYVLTEGRNCYKKVARQGETITEASFELTGKETYIRVTCQDGKGLHADSSAYDLQGKEPELRTYDMKVY